MMFYHWLKRENMTQIKIGRALKRLSNSDIEPNTFDFMTRTIYFVLSFLFISTTVFAQDDYMDDVVSKACSCLEDISPEVTGQGLEMQMGICILNAASSYRDEILADYGLDLNKMDREGEKIGVLIGGKMAAECPNVLVAVTQRTSNDGLSESVETLVTQGTVKEVTTDFLIYFSIKTEKGRTEKFYWYSFVDSEIDLIRQYSEMKNKNVTIEYHKEEFFDPKIMEYRPINVIDVLNMD